MATMKDHDLPMGVASGPSLCHDLAHRRPTGGPDDNAHSGHARPCRPARCAGNVRCRPHPRTAPVAPPPKRRTGLIIGGIVALVVLIVAASTAALVLNPAPATVAAPPTTHPPATAAPTPVVTDVARLRRPAAVPGHPEAGRCGVHPGQAQGRQRTAPDAARRGQRVHRDRSHRHGPAQRVSGFSAACSSPGPTTERWSTSRSTSSANDREAANWTVEQQRVDPGLATRRRGLRRDLGRTLVRHEDSGRARRRPRILHQGSVRVDDRHVQGRSGGRGRHQEDGRRPVQAAAVAEPASTVDAARPGI